jgi:hypothetical protein
VTPRRDLAVEADDADLREGDRVPIVIRRFSAASAITLPPVRAMNGAFHCMVVSDASVSPARFSRTVVAASEQRTNSRPPSAPPTRQLAVSASLPGSPERMVEGARSAAGCRAPP